MIRFNCPICHQTFTAEDSQTGQQFDCECGQKLEVPRSDQAPEGPSRHQDASPESVHPEKSVPRSRNDFDDGPRRRKRSDDDDYDRPRHSRKRNDDVDDYVDDDDYDRIGRRRGPSRQALQEANSKKLAAGLCGILIGGLGIHKFLLGYNTAGIITLVMCILTCGALGIIPLIEGIIYLTKSDEEFYYTYIRGQKEWF